MDAALRGEYVIVFEKVASTDAARMAALELLKCELPVHQETHSQIGFRLV